MGGKNRSCKNRSACCRDGLEEERSKSSATEHGRQEQELQEQERLLQGWAGGGEKQEQCNGAWEARTGAARTGAPAAGMGWRRREARAVQRSMGGKNRSCKNRSACCRDGLEEERSKSSA